VRRKQTMLMESTDNLMIYNNYQTLLSFTDETNQPMSVDVLEKLKIVKANMDLIINLAAWYSIETNKPFSQMLRIGISSVIKSVKVYRDYQIEFSEYLKKEISSSMSKSSI
jgi:hypothetical protein